MLRKLSSLLRKQSLHEIRKTEPTRVALLGSCTTRDVFNSKFNSDYKKYFQIVADQQHMSLLSVMATPIEIKDKKIEGNVTEFYKKVYRQDLQKDFLKRLKASQPEVLILDFYTDVFYGAIKVNDKSFITNKKWQYQKLSHFKNFSINDEYSIYNNTDDFISTWMANFDEFYNYVKKNIPHCQIVINKTKFVNIGRHNGKMVTLSEELNDKWEKFHIDRFNILWNLLDTYAIYKYNLKKIDFDRDKYYCPSNHAWGWFYVHYNQEFYSDTLIKLKNLLKDY